MKLNQNVDAIEYFDTVLSIDSVNVSARFGIGNAFYNMDKPDEAVYHYTQALLQSDTNIDAMIGMLLTGDDASDQTKIERGIRIANEYPDTIYTLIIENEGLYRGTLNEEQIIVHLVIIREKLNSECLVTIAEPSITWLQHPKIVSHVDYVMINQYLYWEELTLVML